MRRAAALTHGDELRDLLTIAAGIVILVLTAALGLPFFVDWNGYRLDVEARLSQALGAPVTVDGAIDMRLLPTPMLALERVSVGQAGGARASAQKAHFEVAVMPLLRGRIEVLEARLERPRFNISLDTLLAGGASPSQDIQFERIVVRNGVVDIGFGGRRVHFEGFDLDARAASLAGPFKGEASVSQNGVRTPLRFSTAEREGDRLRFKLVVDSVVERPRAEFEGALIAGGRFEGRALVAGRLGEASWRMAAEVDADATGARAAKIEARLGEDETIASAGGDGELMFGDSPRGHLKLVARQLDLDRLYALGPGAGAKLDEAVAALSRAAAFKLDMQSDVATLAGETLSGLSARLAIEPKRPAQLDLAGTLPGRTRGVAALALSGTPIGGKLRLQSEDWPRFAQWGGQVAPQAAGALRSLSARDAEIVADLAARPGGFDLEGLTLTLGKTQLSGRAGFRGAAPGQRALLSAELAAPALDLDALPDLSAIEAGAFDLSLKLDARAVRMARAGQAPISAGQIALAMTRDAGGVRLERLRLEDIAGAQVEAKANFSRDGGYVEFFSAAQDFRAPADILRRLAPSALSEAIAARAPALSPMRLTGSAQLLRIGEALVPTGFSIAGQVGGSKLSGQMTPAADGKIQSRLNVEASDGAALLGQLGAPVFDLAGLGAGRISAQALGRIGEPAQAKLEAQFGPSSVTFDGALGLDFGNPRAEGRLVVNSPDIAPLLRGLSLDFPDLTARVPLAVSASAVLADGRAQLSNLAGGIAGARVEGNVTRTAKGPVEGALRFDRLSLPWLAGLVLGPQQPARAGALWSDLRFPPDAAAPPLARLAMEAQALDILPGLAGARARMTAELAPGRLTLSEASADVAGARVEGRLNLRRDGAEANASGQMRVANLGLDWPSVKGRLGFTVDFAGSGVSAAALVGSLAGGGAGEAADLRLPRSDPNAILRVVEAVEADKISLDEASVARALEREFDRGEWRMGAARLDVALIGGALKLAAPGLDATLDLKTMTLEQRNRVASPAAPKGWKGATPQAEVRFVGPVGASARNVDGSALSQALAGRAIAREQARIEAFEFDARERAFFYRRLKSERAREAARVRAAELARLKAIEDARKAAEEAADASIRPPLDILPPAAASTPQAEKLPSLPRELFETPAKAR